MTHEDIWRAIERFARKYKMSCSRLARNSGLDPTTFNKSKRLAHNGKPRWPSTQSLAKIFSFTGSNMNEFARFVMPTELKERN